MYQIVFGTKDRQRTLSKPNRNVLFKYIIGLLNNKKCHVYRVNGVEDHLHILTHLHPSIALSDLVKDIKLSSSSFIKKNQLFPHFAGWQEGYGAFTYSESEKDKLIKYVMNQELHHSKSSFEEEYRILLKEHNVNFDERYL